MAGPVRASSTRVVSKRLESLLARPLTKASNSRAPRHDDPRLDEPTGEAHLVPGAHDARAEVVVVVDLLAQRDDEAAC